MTATDTMNPRYFPLQKRPVRRLWHPSTLNHIQHGRVEEVRFPEGTSHDEFKRKLQEVIGDMDDSHWQVDWFQDDCVHVARIHLAAQPLRISAKIRKLYEP